MERESTRGKERDSKRPSALAGRQQGGQGRVGVQMCGFADQQPAPVHHPRPPTHTHPTPPTLSTPSTHPIPPSLLTFLVVRRLCSHRGGAGAAAAAPVVDWRRLKGRAGLSCCCCSCPWARTARTRRTTTRRNDDGFRKMACMV